MKPFPNLLLTQHPERILLSGSARAARFSEGIYGDEFITYWRPYPHVSEWRTYPSGGFCEIVIIPLE